MLIGITGKTGSGKTTAARIFAKNGIPVVDADAVARTVIADPAVARGIISAFGEGVVRDGSLDRAALAALVFADEEKRKTLEQITHPAIIERVNEELARLTQAGHGIVAVDAALLFEAGYDALCDLTILVNAPKEARLARILARDALSEPQARARMEAQGVFLPKADILWENSGDLAAFVALVESFVRQIKEGGADADA